MNFLKANSVVLLTSSACSLLGENAVLADVVDQKNLTNQSDGSFSREDNTGFFRKVGNWMVEHPVRAVILAACYGVCILLRVVSWLLRLKKVGDADESQKVIPMENTIDNSLNYALPFFLEKDKQLFQKLRVGPEKVDTKDENIKGVTTDSDVEKFNKAKKAISAKDLDIVDLAKIDKYKDGVLKAVYACMFLEKGCLGGDFFRQSFTRRFNEELKKNFVYYLKYLRKRRLVKFENYDPDDCLDEKGEPSKQPPTELVYLCWNTKAVKPEAKKYLAKFVLRNIGLLNSDAKEEIYDMFWGGFCGELLSDEFIKEGEYSPESGFSKKEESMHLRKIGVKKCSPKVKKKSEDVVQNKDKDVLKKAIEECFF